jgi:hypothetical protein|uniref:Uncharacterized protein n=1 Tax=Fagus sylvatica TaxID=28930 RepID=A0A2N9H116_FAGSY
MVVEFFQLLSSFAIPHLVPDGLKWKCSKAGVFDSRSFYAALNERPWCSRGRVYGRLKPLLEWRSLFGWRLGGRF